MSGGNVLKDSTNERVKALNLEAGSPVKLEGATETYYSEEKYSKRNRM